MIRAWQDAAQTIPASEGDPVRVWECGEDFLLVHDSAAETPRLRNGRPILNGVDLGMFDADMPTIV